LQKEDQKNSLYFTVEDHIPRNVLTKKNSASTWEYGYNDQYNMVVISKTGKIGEIVNIQGLIVALPEVPKELYQRHDKPYEQYLY